MRQVSKSNQCILPCTGIFLRATRSRSQTSCTMQAGRPTITNHTVSLALLKHRMPISYAYYRTDHAAFRERVQPAIHHALTPSLIKIEVTRKRPLSTEDLSLTLPPRGAIKFHSCIRVTTIRKQARISLVDTLVYPKQSSI